MTEEQVAALLQLLEASQELDPCWVQRLGEISPRDMVEAQVVNAIAPFLILNGLRENLGRWWTLMARRKSSSQGPKR